MSKFCCLLGEKRKTSPFLYSRGLHFQLTCTLCKERIKGSKVYPHCLMVSCRDCNVTFSEGLYGVVGLLGHPLGDQDTLAPQDKDTITDFFPLLKSVLQRERVRPRCPFHGHLPSLQDVHGVTVASEFPPVIRNNFFLRCLFTGNRFFETCNYVKCLSANNRKESKESEKAYKNT